MRYYSTIILLCLANVLYSQDSFDLLIPRNHKLLKSEKGDLNKDGIDDLVLISEETDENNFITNDKFGPDTININPRGILIYFGDGNNEYSLIEKNFKGFIPSENDKESPCLADPLLLAGGVSIEKNILNLHFNYWLSCGSWYVSDMVYKFRYQHNTFELIGLEYNSFHRASGDAENISMNFSTKKKAYTTGMNEFANSQPTTKWSTIKLDRLYQLKDCDEDTYFKILDL